jgi:hypothetical protein
LVEDDASAPHLRIGEYAIVDLGDREIQNGELYVIQVGFSRSRYIKQVQSDLLNITGPGAEPSPVWWLSDLRGFRKTNEIALARIPVFAGLSDGPYTTEDVQSKVLGRIVGYAVRSLGGLIAAKGGYENEAAGNAAFDPAEYLDVLIAAGYRPGVYQGAYYEEMPGRAHSDAEDAALLAVQWKRVAASTAVERLKQECIRRGLVHGRAG